MLAINYGHLLYALACVLLWFPVLWIQLAILGLSTEGGPLPPAFALMIGAIACVPHMLIILVLSLFGGARFALKAAGWILVLYLLGYGLMVTALAPTPAEAWFASPLNRFPVAIGALLLTSAVGLAMVLIRSIRRSPKPRTAFRPLA